jgi:hypothetical protein
MSMSRLTGRRVLGAAALLAVLASCGVILTEGETRSQMTADLLDSGSAFAPERVDGGDGEEFEVEPKENAGKVEESTRSFFRTIQIDPAEERTAGPKFIDSGDINNDGLIDILSGWNQSQPIQIHLQERDENGRVSFETINIAGTFPVTTLGGLRLGDFNGDGWLDIAMAIKNTGVIQFCNDPAPACADPMVFDADEGLVGILINPGNAEVLRTADTWIEVTFPLTRLSGRRDIPVDEEENMPENNSYTDLEVADFDGINGPDIIVAFNPAECECNGERPPNNRVMLLPNPGPDLITDGMNWQAIWLEVDAPAIKDLEVSDVDSDGDPDIVVTYPIAITQNVRWLRNPLVPHTVGGPSGPAEVVRGQVAWETRPIGQVDPGADVVELGDVDLDGFDDVVVRSTIGGIVQWFRRPNGPIPIGTIDQVGPPNPVPARIDIPWAVFTLTEMGDRVPEGMAVGDLTGRGQNEVAIGVEGAVVFFDSSTADNAYDLWTEIPIVIDTPPDDPNSPAGTIDTSTNINELVILDLNNDGFNDIIATFDRRQGAGVSDDVLLWFRNTLTKEDLKDPVK